MDRKKVDVEAIISRYNNGESIYFISKQIGISRGTIKSRLIKLGIPVEPRYTKTYTKQTSLLDHERITTEAEAYLLGIYMADGTVSPRDKMVGIDLSTKDIKHIETIKSIWKVDNLVHSVKNNHSGSSYLRIYDRNLYANMNRFGVVHNKSSYGKFPNENWFIDSLLIRHYIRGYFDGDGCFSYSHLIRPMINFVGTIDMIEGIAGYIKTQLGYNMTRSIQPNKQWGTISVGGFNQISHIMKWMYENTNLYLPRKHNRYSKFLKERKAAGYRFE